MFHRSHYPLFALFLLLSACTDKDPHTDGKEDDTEIHHTGETGETDAGPEDRTVEVWVTLDGEPASYVTLVQPGTSSHWMTDMQGLAVVTADLTVPGGDIFIAAAHPEARIRSVQVPKANADETELPQLQIALSRYAEDNPVYIFKDPGSPDRRDTTTQCAHCHVAISGDWFNSPHRQSASNPTVQDLYAGTTQAYTTKTACEGAGGHWWKGIEPGTTNFKDRCYLGEGVLPSLNTHCGETEPCDTTATQFGSCADCHAPAINGQLGGRNLLDAKDLEFSEGVHCDLCHHVDEVDITAPPGVAGRLVITRPSEPASTSGVGDFEPLSFGPYDDVPTPVMGAVYRDHFSTPLLCAGCHEHQQPVLLPGQSINLDRWPEGTLPIQTTYTEWKDGPMFNVQPCQACHMPPDATAGNSADLYQMFQLTPGFVAGWERPAGAVRKHSWVGPRQPESQMLQLAASVFIEKQVSDGLLTAQVRVKNVGPGHALPTGEPLRSMVLLVRADCGTVPLVAVGGDTVPAFGGYLAKKGVEDDWSTWPEASVGQTLVVVQNTGAFLAYDGPGAFGGDRFTPAEKGLPSLHFIGSVQITSVDGDVVTTSAPIPEGDTAYLLHNEDWPTGGDPIGRYAGRPGMAFAKVLVGADGTQMTPHFAAVDVQSDNRLMPQTSWTSEHTFTTECEAPTVTAKLIYQPYPARINDERLWNATETLMTEATR